MDAGLVGRFSISGVAVQNWMLVAFAIIAVWIAVAWLTRR
jgi:hypothetical protein